MSKTTKQAVETVEDGKVLANPTKKFFVTMLTRDIALMDAIMDLIDNCIDGVHRQNRKVKGDKDFFYKGYHADINLDAKSFVLKDNCGGIPLEVAKHYAFKMGRSDDYHEDDKLETLGMYGIGMKRAIFKIGMKAEVLTMHAAHTYKVAIPEDWSTTGDWTFDYAHIKKTEIRKYIHENGTVIKISSLHPNIGRQFNDKSGFLKDLMVSLKQHYGYIIRQGFRITLNGERIEPIELNILTVDPRSKIPKAIRPYVYTSKIGDVNVEIIVGFYRPPPSEEEIQEQLEGTYAPAQSDNAGVTVLCNNRVVLYCDKTFLTGWGDNPVPKYHTQFINIAGVVHFRSTNPIDLPVTTTKRGLDTSSAVYGTAKNKIKDGLRYFTSFTNEWKAQTKERTQLFSSAKKIDALKPGQSRSSLVKLSAARKGDSGEYQIPNLPKPARPDNKFVTISFAKEKQKIDEVREAFLDSNSKSAAEVGSWCFDKIHSQIDK